MENNFQLATAAISDRGLSEKRPQNEDSYLELREKGIFAVADGVGGAQAGDVASQMAVEILGEAFIHAQPGTDAEDIMRAAIKRANEAIFQMSHDLPQLATMATTIVALHIAGNIATIGHAGDSRLYRVDQTGQLFRETADHSVVEEEVRAGRMTNEQAQHHPSRNVISRALGAEQNVDVDLKTMWFEPNTTFLLCSDGITRHIDDGEIASFLSSDMQPADICQRMKDLCYSRGAEDNLTAVIVRVLAEAADARPSTLAPVGAEAEEATIAAARSPFEEKAESFVPPTTRDAEEESTAVRPVPAAVPAAAAAAESTPFLRSSNYDDRSSTGSGSTILTAIAMLVLGSLIGAGVYHYLFRPEPEVREVQVPAMPEAKSNNIPFSAYEENRRNVDKDPAAYLTAAGAATPEDAEDFYLRARAYMLAGKYWEAKQDLNEAKNRLAQSDPMNAKVLATDIAMALATINSGPAQQAFQRDVSASPPATAAPLSGSAPAETLPTP